MKKQCLPMAEIFLGSDCATIEPMFANATGWNSIMNQMSEQ